jgi:predicted amidohydrolase
MMRLGIIEKIGFFHCVDFGLPADPIAKLREEIETKIHKEKQRDQTWDISNSLLVLPEAFNIGQYDPRSEPQQPASTFLESLRELAAQHRVILVSGILDGRRNSAYLIDAKVAHLMCHKIGDDLTGIYDPCTGDPDPCNPITFRNACVGALICLDAATDAPHQPHIRQRLEDFVKRLSLHEGKKIVCVPGRFRFPRNLDCCSQMTDCWYIMAQGTYTGESRGSFFADSSHKKVAEAIDANEVKIWRLP